MRKTALIVFLLAVVAAAVSLHLIYRPQGPAEQRPAVPEPEAKAAPSLSPVTPISVQTANTVTRQEKRGREKADVSLPGNPPTRASPATQEVRSQRSEVRNFSGVLIIDPSIRPISSHSAVISVCSVSVM